VLLYGLVCSKNIKSCSASQWKSNTDNKTFLLLKWSLYSISHRKCKTHSRDISSKVCVCCMARLTLSKNSNSASLTVLLYRLFRLLSHDGDNNNASVIMELWFCFVIMPDWYIKNQTYLFFLSHICCNKVRNVLLFPMHVHSRAALTGKHGTLVRRAPGWQGAPDGQQAKKLVVTKCLFYSKINIL